MIDEKNSKDKIVIRQSIQQSLLHTLQQCIHDNVLQNKINKEKAKFTVKFTVDHLVKKTAKNFNMNYRMAKERAKVDEMQFRLDRILRMMRPNFSTENYKDIINGQFTLKSKADGNVQGCFVQGKHVYYSPYPSTNRNVLCNTVSASKCVKRTNSHSFKSCISHTTCPAGTYKEQSGDATKDNTCTLCGACLLYTSPSPRDT